MHYGLSDVALAYETDDIDSFFVHCYHLLDWIAEDDRYGSCKGKKACHKDSCPECWVNSHVALKISRDLCIRAKHVRLSRDKTGKPRLIRHQSPGAGGSYHAKHLIQWPDRATFDKTWVEIQRECPNAFSGESAEATFRKGYWDNGYEQDCWLAAYEKGECRDAFEVAAEAREAWKMFFLKMGEADTVESYEYWFGPDNPGVSVLGVI